MTMLLLCGGESVSNNFHQSELSSSSSSSNFNLPCSSRSSIMVQQKNRCSNNTGRFSEKSKQKKIPQRGLGVAQLEKIRIEEQLKKEAVSTSPCCISLRKSHVFPALTPNSSFHLSPLTDSVFSFSNLQHHFSPKFTQNFITPSQMDSFSATTNHGLFLWPSFGDKWSQNHETEISKMEHFGFRSSLSDLTGLFDLGSSSLTRKSNILLNKPLLSSSSSSSQMEPPSNQSYKSSNITSRWIDEERTAGMKRPGSFFNPFHGRSTCLSGSNYRSEELIAQDPFKLEPGITIFEDSYCSTSTAVQINWKSSSESDVKIKNDHAVLDDAFLTLGPSHSSSIRTQSSTFSHQNVSNFNFFPPQEIIGETSNNDSFFHSELHQQPFYVFMDGGCNSRALGSDERRAAEGASKPFIDLNLKL